MRKNILSNINSLFCFLFFALVWGNTLSGQSTGVIVLEKQTPSTSVMVRATQQVVLKPGFHATGEAGSSFDAKIGTTNSLSPVIQVADGSTITIPTSPTTSQNYILTKTYLLPADDSPTLNTIQYFDGLGRPTQTTVAGITPSGADLISRVSYDDAGRENIKYLPVSVGGNFGLYADDSSISSATTTLYGANNRPYVETLLEASSLARVMGQKKPGADWDTHPASVIYDANGSDILYFSVSGNNLLKGTNYDEATLYKTTTTDEDGKQAVEYKDKLGHVVVKQSSTDVYTYYVYNDLEQLAYVLPPAFIDGTGATASFDATNSLLKQYAYVYRYDERGNCIYKKLPGCDPIYMVYDQANRLVLSQDGNQRQKLPVQWTTTKYDILGRVICTGLTNSITASQDDLITTYKDQIVTETYSSGSYANVKFPDATPLMVNYYDDYSFLPDGNSLKYDATQESNGYTPKWANATGLLTGTKVYYLDGSGNSNTTALYYDDKGHVVQSRSTNHLSGYDLVYNQYDFTGKVLKTYKTHGISGASDTYKELYTNTYDNGQRLKTTTYSLNGTVAVTLVSNSYDELGRLQTKTIGNGVDATTYNYNIQGHITEINGNKLSEKLYYNTNPTNLPDFTPCYNGNIAGIKWNVASESLGYQRAYSFAYDDLNRLINAKYYGVSNSSIVSGVSGRYNEHFEFDKVGNITNFVRYGLQANNTTMIYGKIDDLVLDHRGNQLTKVTDNGTNGIFTGDEEFVKNTVNSANSCGYDPNGNRLYDSNSNVWGIKYNLMNLPDAIQFYPGHQTNYSYTAGSEKLRVIEKTAPQGAELPVTSLNTVLANPSVAMTTTTDYVGNMIYENGILKRILTSEGYYQDGRFHYFLKDHLGSVRVVLRDDKAVLEQNHYYPSGMRFGESAVNGGSVQPYRHTGHEMQEMHGLNWIDNNARFRTVSDGGGFTGVDPLCEKYPDVSPYVYCNNNPIRFIDPTGMEFTDAAWKEVKRLIADINTRQKSNNEAIAEKKEKLKEAGYQQDRKRD